MTKVPFDLKECNPQTEEGKMGKGGLKTVLRKKILAKVLLYLFLLTPKGFNGGHWQRCD